MRKRTKSAVEPTFIISHDAQNVSLLIQAQSALEFDTNSTPSTPSHLALLLPIPGLNLDEPFASPEQFRHSPSSLFTDASYHTPISTTRRDLTWSPDTPVFTSSSEAEPSSSPEIATPSCTVPKWKAYTSDDFRADKPTIQHHSSANLRNHKLSKATDALNVLAKLGISLFDLVDIILEPKNVNTFLNQQNNFF
ncbi:hypothetical protein BT96DRAFT_1001245 [Gymnopus androsaceus JB14]|uniref:Uncharacterized protein n=1 Tax=Gymnopus androsaceus JB14 TaxID=1447944 RepID=A0A6A4H1C7_9AGAR|nr:hypothetical protein BT96DRAFT_1001245 [Gymnopus androsaceus JB14]